MKNDNQAHTYTYLKGLSSAFLTDSQQSFVFELHFQQDKIKQMNHLTIETMDRINFLLTEVSLECLGNKFFDIYGNQTDSLLNLISAESLRQKPSKSASESKLLKALNIDSFKYDNARKVQLPKLPVSRKRRMSLSDKDKPKEIQLEPETLLVPMNPPKSAKISNRRQTINVSQPQAVPMRFREPNKFVNRPSKSLTAAELKHQLKRDINESKCLLVN